MATKERINELKERILNSFKELLSQVEDLERKIEDLEFEKQCLNDRIAELEEQIHEAACHAQAQMM